MICHKHFTVTVSSVRMMRGYTEPSLPLSHETEVFQRAPIKRLLRINPHYLPAPPTGRQGRNTGSTVISRHRTERFLLSLVLVTLQSESYKIVPNRTTESAPHGQVLQGQGSIIIEGFTWSRPRQGFGSLRFRCRDRAPPKSYNFPSR